MPDENYGASLSVNNALSRSDIVGERCRRILNDRDRVAVLPQDVIDALPTRAVHKTTVHQDNRLCSQTCSFSHDDLLSLETDFVLVNEVLDQSKYLSARPHDSPKHDGEPGSVLRFCDSSRARVGSTE